MEAKGELQRSAIRGAGLPCDVNAYLWPREEPAFDALLAAEVEELARGDSTKVEFLTGIAQRLRGELHMPAVREALGCLISRKPASASRQAEASRIEGRR